MKVDFLEYPKALEWENKVFSMPNIPRGDVGLIEGLRLILEMVKNNVVSTERVNIVGSDSKITLNEACIRLRPMRLVLKTENGWALSQESEKWLETGDDLYLAAVLCSRIKFVAEILYYLDTPKTAAQIQEIAVGEYSLNWKTTSDINSRLVWLRQLGLVEFQEFSLLYLLTDLGKEFIKRVNVSEPIKVDYSFDETINEEKLEISEWAIKYCEKLPLDRKISIGYILGDVKQFHNTVLEFIQLLSGGKTYNSISIYVEKNYGIAFSSLKSFLTTLSNMHIIERKTDVIYDITQEAKKLLDKFQILDLLCMMHKHFGFMFELLSLLENKSMSYKELAATAKVSYGFERENIDEIRKRIAIFKVAKLVKNATVDRYTITNRAKKLLELINVEHPMSDFYDIESNLLTEQERVNFFTELRLATRDSFNFEKLEKQVRIAFEKLGFQAEWIGGSGKTDVLIQAAGNNSFSVTIDAKSTMSGVVGDGLVDFDTILEHKRKHHADFSAIVGGSFQNERLIKRAIEHNVVLFDVDTLEMLIRNHAEVPLRVTSYRKIFQRPGLVDITCLDDERNVVKRYGNLLHAVMDCLVAERDDPVTHGILQERDIYRSLRSNVIFLSAPSLEEISNMLEFLSSPLIGCVEKIKNGYCAIGTLNDAAQKFQFFARMCNSKVDC